LWNGFGILIFDQQIRKMKTKEEFHQLIDSIEDENVLRAYFELVRMLNLPAEGRLMKDLSSDQRAELMSSYQESFDEGQWVSQEEMKNRNSQWLSK
jgi:hypothetical protein